MVRGKGKGFTLTEILVVIVILATMSALVLPRLTGQPERARAAEAVLMLDAIRQGEEAFRLDFGSYIATGAAAAAPMPAFSWAVLGLDNPDNANFTYTIAATQTTFTATATRAAAAAHCANTTITLNEAGDHGGTNVFSPKPDVGAAC